MRRTSARILAIGSALLAIAGAAFRGVGVPACIRDALHDIAANPTEFTQA